jgi:ubiquinone/menaquinone biosynthesis C-methylase UbiE
MRIGYIVSMKSQRERIVEQFSRQAVPFSTAASMRNEQALQLLVQASHAGPEDAVLDVACGPGLVACAFARHVRHVTGIDLTSAMIERARELAREQRLVNLDWRCGDVVPLPFADDSFSVVVSRLAFHHFPDPARVLSEMMRVCRPGGRVVVADLIGSEDPVRAAAFHRMEMLRDPSHVRALSLAQLRGLFEAAGLRPHEEVCYRLENEFEAWLARSFPVPGSEPEIRRMFQQAMPDDGFDLQLRRDGAEVRFTFQVVVLSAQVPLG